MTIDWSHFLFAYYINRFSSYIPSSVFELGLEPFYSIGDGFYNSLSILMSGDEYDSEIYRLGTAMYGLKHYDHIVEAVRKSFQSCFLVMLRGY